MKAEALLVLVVILTGCGTYRRQGLEPARLQEVERALAGPELGLTADLEKQVLALNPTNVTAKDVREVLSHTPAPRIIKIHGGLAEVIPAMVSFTEFLIGMGYPAASLTNPGDGTYTFSCYESSEKIAGAMAWYYEKEGLRPMMVGHSQGGMQVVKVLYDFAGKASARLYVWNPLTWQKEKRWEIRDPLTGGMRPVVDLRWPYATAVGAGGLTRVLPNQWDMNFRLHNIPDSVEEFTGFCKALDPLGGDFLGYGSANHFKSAGVAVVRNVWLPTEYPHGGIPDTKHLLDDPAIVAWIDEYRPSDEAVSTPKLEVEFEASTKNLLWAADVWFSIKKHWVMELQRRIKARQQAENKS